MLQQAISVSLLSAIAALAPASSQGIQKSASISGNAPWVAPATKVLVATPYPTNPADSLTAVALGNAIRDQLSSKIGGSDWVVITRREVNNNLQTWGYGADQVFAPESAKLLASKLTAQVFVMTTLSKTPSGLFTVSIRVTGLNDDAGQVMPATQLAGQKLADFGSKIADQAAVIFRAYPDAKTCNDNYTTTPAKAIEGANKALKVVPNYGNAEYCLGMIEHGKDSVGAETIRRFKNATLGDPLSLRAVNQLAIIHQLKHDTAGVVEDYQRMVTIAPNNTPLATEAVRVFKTWGKPDAADQVVQTQSKLDPTNADWPYLQGTSCAAAGVTDTNDAKQKVHYACAFAAFSRVDSLDPARADTTFFPMIVFVAGTRADSMHWAKQWAEKYSSSPDPLNVEMQLYTDAGQLDSAKQVVRLLVAIDPTDAKPVLALEQVLLKQKKYDEALSLAPIFPKGADAKQRDQFAGLLVQEGQVIIADTANKSEAKDSTLARMGHVIVASNPATPVYAEMGNYFVVMSYVPGFTRLGTAAGNEKTCDAATKYEAHLTAMAGEPALKALGTATTPSLVQFSSQLSTSIQDELTGAQRVPAMKKAWCKP